MELYDIPTEEIVATKKRFPKLKHEKKGIWTGVLEFDREYREYRISDSFEIAVGTYDYPTHLPFVTETGGRIKAIAEKYHLKDIRDVHWTNGSGACLCVRQEEKIKFPPGSDFVYFIDNLVIPYFYGLSYFEENGRWPWLEYSHGGLGLLEYYAKDPVEQTASSIAVLANVFTGDKDNWRKYRTQLMNPNSNKACICGSGNSFSRCSHTLAWKGLVRLHEDLKRLRLNPYKVFTRLTGQG
jgi:hypothetical protein